MLALEQTMMNTSVQYISDATGNPIGVFVPIEVWRGIWIEDETDYILSSPKMRQRLLAALKRNEGIPFEEALEKLGI